MKKMKFKTLFPFMKWMPKMKRRTVTSDMIAGLIGAIVVLPQGVAFATIAGLPPEYGLYAAIVPAIAAALWGSSRHLVSGPTTAISLVIFATISPLAQPGTEQYIKYVLTVTLLVGAIQLLMGWLKFGKILNFISHTVVVGFTAGAALLIISSQLKNFVGIPIPQGSSFYETIHMVITKFHQTNAYVFAVALTTLAVGMLIRKLWPKVPYMIPALLIGSILGFYLNEHFGAAVTGIKTIGALPRSLPPFSLSSFDIDIIRKMASPALAITMLALVEAVAISRAIALKSGQKIDNNQEIIGQGVSNVLGSFFSAYPASGSFNRTGLNFESGAKTQMSSVFAAIFLAIIIIFVAPLAAYLPTAVMAGLLFLVAWGLIDFHHIKNIVRASKSEGVLLVVTFLATLFLELEFAIFIGVLMSVANYLRYSSLPLVTLCAPDTNHPRRKFSEGERVSSCPQLAIVKIDGSLFFGSMDHLENTIKKLEESNPEQNNILFILTGVHLIDLAGIDFLINLIKKRRASGGDVYISNANRLVRKKMKKAGFFEVIGDNHIFESKQDAISWIVPCFDKSKCKACKARIFHECEGI